jgi:membrane-bound ClpP family serine protease
VGTAGAPPTQISAPGPLPLAEFLTGGPNLVEIHKRLREDIQSVMQKHASITDQYCCIGLVDADTSIGKYELDRVFEALTAENPARDHDVLLVLLSSGGSIEPAYQISKLCKQYSKTKFVVTVPRQAKSAATLISLGADEIHMGPLGQLGPIDPQLGSLPALGVSQALQSIAQLSQQYPGSSEMFARYLVMALTVEQIGYSQRVCESAAQYAERLLATKKKKLPKPASVIANELVHEYKDHGFVIDLDEARTHLGADWVLTDTAELAFAEDLYSYFEDANLWLGIVKKGQYLILAGNLDKAQVFTKKR